MDLAEQLLKNDNSAGRTFIFIEGFGGILPKFLRGSPHPDDGSCTFCSDESFWGEYKLHVSTFATTRVALLTGGAAR